MNHRLVLVAWASLLCLFPQTAGKPGAKSLPSKPGVKEAGVQRAVSLITPESSFSIEGVPDWIAIAEDSVWISNKPKHTVSRIDTKTNKVVVTVHVGKQPCSGLAVGFGSVWVPNCGDQTVSRIDLKTNLVAATVAVGPAHSEGAVAVGPDSIWLPTDSGAALARIDPATNKAVARITLPPGSYAAAYGEDSVWVTSTEKNQVSRIDPKTNLVVETIEVGKAPRFLAVGEGAVWTLNQTEGNVSRIDPKTNKVIATIAVGVPGPGGDIAAGEGYVWVTAFDIPLSRIDPATDKVVEQFTGPGGDAIRVGHGSVWLSNLRQQTVWRIDPKRL